MAILINSLRKLNVTKNIKWYKISVLKQAIISIMMEN